MNPIATKRPGVYSQYAVTSLYARPGQRTAAALGRRFSRGGGGDPPFPLQRGRRPAGRLGISRLFPPVWAGGGRGLPLPAATDTAEGYAAAFAALEPVAEVGCILCDKAEEDILDALQESCQRASEGSRERLGFCGVDDSAAASSLASSLNSERMVLVCPAPLPGRCGMPSFGRGGSGRGKSSVKATPPPGSPDGKSRCRRASPGTGTG